MLSNLCYILSRTMEWTEYICLVMPIFCRLRGCMTGDSSSASRKAGSQEKSSQKNLSALPQRQTAVGWKTTDSWWCVGNISVTCQYNTNTNLTVFSIFFFCRYTDKNSFSSMEAENNQNTCATATFTYLCHIGKLQLPVPHKLWDCLHIVPGHSLFIRRASSSR